MIGLLSMTIYPDSSAIICVTRDRSLGDGYTIYNERCWSYAASMFDVAMRRYELLKDILDSQDYGGGTILDLRG